MKALKTLKSSSFFALKNDATLKMGKTTKVEKTAKTENREKRKRFASSNAEKGKRTTNAFRRAIVVGVLALGVGGFATAQTTERASGLSRANSESVATNENGLNGAAASFAPLVDASKKLKRLDKTAPIWVSTDRANVVLGGTICLREGLLEFFACRRGSKEHESIVALDVPPHLICAALLAIGAKQGTPAKFEPKFVPPTGEEIEIEVRWRDGKNGEIRKIRAQEMVVEETTGKPMSVPWVFTGGVFGVDADGKKYYLANVTGEIFGVSNFPGSVLDVPLESSSNNAQLMYAPNTPKIPPIGTDVTLILSRKNKTTQK